MSDNIESRMNFIIEQQAQFAADIQLLKERQADAQRMIEANSGMIEANTSMMRQLVDVSISLARQLEETDRRLGARIEQLAESGAHTDRRLDALIGTVDKLARRNGP
jgi:hypothetical protein